MGVRKREMANAIKEDNKQIAFAKLNNCPTSPRKMRLVADLVRGQKVERALNILRKYCKDNNIEEINKLYEKIKNNNMLFKSKTNFKNITYNNENTKAVKDADGNIISEAVGNVELCVLQEFILRYFNAIKKDNYNWFLTPELAIWHKLYKVFV
jgi:ribosomal protein L22